MTAAMKIDRRYYHLWRYNKVTGYWRLERSCHPDDAARWLDIFSKDEPGEFFRLVPVGDRRPQDNPTR